MVNNNNEYIRQATAPDISREWEARESGLVVSAQGNVRFMARVEPHGPNGELNDGDKAVLAQIVREHNIVPKLVAALKEALVEAEVSTVLWQQSRGFVGTVEDAYGKGLMPPAFVRARAALVALGRERRSASELSRNVPSTAT